MAAVQLPECGRQWVKSCPGGSGNEVFPYGTGKQFLQGPAEPRIPWEWLWKSVLFEMEAWELAGVSTKGMDFPAPWPSSV